MANEINIVLSETGLTLICKIWSATTQIGSNISLTENTNRSGHYYGDAPATISNGDYTAIIETSGGTIKGALSLVFVNNQLQQDLNETRLRDDELAEGGTSTSIYLSMDASDVHNIYVGATIYIVSGPGAGQLRQITGYNGSNRRATVSAWYVIPDDTSVYRVLK